MRMIGWGCLVWGMLALYGCAGSQTLVSTIGMPQDAPVVKVSMTAQKYEFKPSEVRVPQGSHVILEVESLDVTHGISIPAYGIDAKLPPDRKVTVEFYAKDAGTFPFHCSVFCGMGHMGMRGAIVVEKLGK